MYIYSRIYNILNFCVTLWIYIKNVGCVCVRYENKLRTLVAKMSNENKNRVFKMI